MIYAIDGALTLLSSVGTGTAVYSDVNHLHGPTNLTMLPDDDLIGVNSDSNAQSEPAERTGRVGSAATLAGNGW
jgi:hypothetical protein